MGCAGFFLRNFSKSIEFGSYLDRNFLDFLRFFFEVDTLWDCYCFLFETYILLIHGNVS